MGTRFLPVALTLVGCVGLAAACAPRLTAACPPTPVLGAPPTPPAASSGPAIRLGGVQIVHIDGKYDIWTKRIGSGPVQVLLLPGGPGCSHDYLAPFEDFLPPHGVQMIYYDPLDTGQSARPGDKSLWTLDRFVGEVEQVRAALGLDHFYLFGHSWGGILGLEYALRHPEHLEGLILSNTSPSTRSLDAYSDELVARDTSPEKLQKIKDLESHGIHDGPEYEALYSREAQDTMGRRMCAVRPWPQPVQYGCFGSGGNVAAMSSTMLGPHRSDRDGNLRDWDRWNDLRSLAMPVLVVGVEDDYLSPRDAEKMARSIPHGRAVILDRGSHLAMYANQGPYFDAILRFLDDSEGAARR